MRSTFCLLIICFIGFLTVSTSSAQSSQIDSLKAALVNNDNEIACADLNFALSEQLYNNNFELGYEYAQAALKIAERAGYTKGIAQALTSIGTYFYYIGEFILANQYYKKALQTVSIEKFKDYPFKTYIRLSILYRTKSDFDTAAYFLDAAGKLLPTNEINGLHASYYASLGVLENHISENRNALEHLRNSLKIRKALADSSGMANTWRNIGITFMDQSAYDSAAFYYAKAALLLEQYENPEVTMALHLNKGEMYFALGEINKAIENYNLALDILQTNTYRKYYARLLHDLGELYSNQNDYKTGFNYLFQAVSEFEKLENKQDLARSYSTIGWNYIFQENYSKATEYGEKSLKLVQAINDSAGISKSQNLIGFALLKTGKYTKALDHFESALAIRHKLGLRWGETYTLYNQALAHYELGHTKEAFALLYKALDLAKEINNKSAYVYINNELGLLYAKTKDYRLAERHLEDAQNVAKAVPLASELLTNYKNYITLLELKKDTKNSLIYYRWYTSLKDSIDHIISSGRIANADALFQVQKKTDELQTKIDENLIQEEKIGEQTKLIQVQKRSLIVVSVCLFLLISLLAAIVRLLILRSRAKEKLRVQNQDIQEQKEEIQTQSEELIEANQHLETLIETLSEKNAEIEAQADLLGKTNNNLEMQVADRTTKLTTAYAELETFFYKASHDFRRPLTTYFGLVEVANSILKDKLALELFEKVRLTTMGLDKMIFKLQSIGNIDYKNESIEFSVANLISDCIHSNNNLIEAKGISITTPEESITIYNNYSLFKIVIFNLIENAIFFCHPSKPQIDIQWTTTESEAAITVKDNGSGIIESVQSRIFEMFFRGNESSQGNGLGLYVTKRAIEKLEGKITFTSTVNKGSTFIVTVPLQVPS